MIVARNIGRLGNNMLQISAAIGYARKYGYQWAADPASGLGEPYSAIHKIFPNLPKQQPRGARYHEHPHGICRIHRVSYDICHFDYHPIPDLGSSVFLTGFFQSWKYFEGQDEEIKKVFNLPHVEGYEDYVSIHVRRGDYVQYAGSFPPLTMDFISKAMFEQSVRGNVKFKVFSDDIEWCKQNVNGDYEINFSEGRNELQDLSLMASCGHHIIANSTFSWWAAYLGHNPDRVVITPSAQTWFGPTSGVKRPVVDLLPKEWIQIHTR